MWINSFPFYGKEESNSFLRPLEVKALVDGAQILTKKRKNTACAFVFYNKDGSNCDSCCDKASNKIGKRRMGVTIEIIHNQNAHAPPHTATDPEIVTQIHAHSQIFTFT